MPRELAREKKWRRCLQCKFYVEKTEGCLHITSRSVPYFRFFSFIFFLILSFVGHEHGMPRVTIVRKQNTTTERIVDSRT